MALLAGGTLAVAGCSLQGLFKNPLVDSGILGVSADAGLGATVVISLGMNFSASTQGAIMGAALVGGLVGVILVYMLSQTRGECQG